MALDKKLSDICERLEWTVREDDDGTIELAKFSPAGEDFNICVDSKDFIQRQGIRGGVGHRRTHRNVDRRKAERRQRCPEHP